MIFLYLLLFAGLTLHAFALAAIFIRGRRIPEINDYPKISIWVAARNEEENILRCLVSLDQLDYPKGKIQILIGNDGSEDRTEEIVLSFIKDKSHFQLITITDKLGKAEKKANVLAQLAHASTGDYFLVCDADIQAKPSWPKEMMRHFTKGVGVVSATTLIDDSSLFAKMQRFDWLYFMGLIKSAASFGIPCTAVGNNMAMSKEAYWATGGYENIDFSITEDFKLFRSILDQGYGFRHLCNEKSTSLSAAAPDFKTLLKQRKRWLEGGRDLPLYWKFILAIYAGFNLGIVTLLFFHPWLALFFVLCRILLQFLFIQKLFHKVKEAPLLFLLIPYIFYSTLVSASTALGFLLPLGKEWKGRKYG